MTKSAKEKLAVKLSETDKTDNDRKGKPVFPIIYAATVLTDLVELILLLGWIAIGSILLLISGKTITATGKHRCL